MFPPQGDRVAGARGDAVSVRPAEACPVLGEGGSDNDGENEGEEDERKHAVVRNGGADHDGPILP